MSAETLDAPAITARLRPLLFERAGSWFAPIAFNGATDPAPLAALADDGAIFVDMHAETDSLVSGGAARAGWWLAGGAIAALLAMLAGLRQLQMVARIALAIGSAGLGHRGNPHGGECAGYR